MRGVHVFVEKPMCTSVVEAEELVSLAEEKGLVLQVGHIERFNESFIKNDPFIIDPLVILASRTCVYNGRCRDVCVVLDLMIHDLDIVLHYMGPWKSIKSKGRVSNKDGGLDQAFVNIEFDNGRVAELRANRNALVDERFMVFQFDSEPPIYVDFHEKKNDALMDEVIDFIGSVKSGRSPKVTGHDGLLVIKAAHEIKEGIGYGETM
jgi:predicted dehydrogenase